MRNEIRSFRYTLPKANCKYNNICQNIFTYEVGDEMEIEGEAIKMQLTDYSYKNPNHNPKKIISQCKDKKYE
jgi:hypothetical protein